MKKAAIVRHVPFEDLGNLKPALEKNGYEINYFEAGVDDLIALAKTPPDLLVILGGPIGAYEDISYPFLRTELQLIEQRLIKNLPVLGICLGGQLIARALGARVYSGVSKEIGWSSLKLTPEGSQSALRHVGGEGIQVLHWHGDTFDLPEGAICLASTDNYTEQAFSWGASCLALQFHPEVSQQGMERWYIGHANEIATTDGIEVVQLRQASEAYAGKLQAAAARFWQEWIEGLEHISLFDAAAEKSASLNKNKKRQ